MFGYKNLISIAIQRSLVTNPEIPHCIAEKKTRHVSLSLIPSPWAVLCPPLFTTVASFLYASGQFYAQKDFPSYATLRASPKAYCGHIFFFLINPQISETSYSY